MRLSSLRPRHHHAIVTAGILAGVVGVALSENSPAAALGLHATDRPLATETAAVRVSTGETLVTLLEESSTVRPTAPVTKKSAPRDIAAFETHLAWAGALKSDADDRWTNETTTAVKLFQRKNKLPAVGFGDEVTVNRLIKISRGGRLDDRCYGRGIRICVDKRQKVARYLRDGEVLREIDVNIGPERGDANFGRYSSTRLGVNPIGNKQVNAVSTLYGYQMPYWMQFDGGIGFHYSEYFDQTGYRDTSMGCVIIGDRRDAAWLYNNTPLKTRVIVYA